MIVIRGGCVANAEGKIMLERRVLAGMRASRLWDGGMVKWKGKVRVNGGVREVRRFGYE